MDIRLPDGRSLDLSYFVEWRPYLWQKPVAQALASLGDLRGKRVLEIGGRSGRISSLLAMLGARVTMLELGSVDRAIQETQRWGVQDRVRAIQTGGCLDAIAGQQFDVLFTKSVLWSVKDLEDLLRALSSHLVPDASIAFVENNRGGPLLRWVRRRVARIGYESSYHGIRRDQFPLFRQLYRDVRITSHLGLVYVITGRYCIARSAMVGQS